MAEQITINAADDAMIAESAPDTEYGEATTASVGATIHVINHVDRVLLRFPTNAIPTDARIIAAELWMYCTTAAASAEAAIWWRMNVRDWLEAEVTWNERYDGVAWGAPGGDFGGLTNWGLWNLPTATGDTKIHEADSLVEEVEYAIANDGYVDIILKRSSEVAPPNATAVFAMNEHATYDGPRLIVDYIPVGVQIKQAQILGAQLV